MTKSTRILSKILLALPSAMLLMSAFMKLSQSPVLVESFNKIGLAGLLIPIGIIELVSVILLWIPKTKKIGFLLLCSYLGGAISIELAGGQFPTAAVILSVLWIGMYFSDREVLLKVPTTA